MAEAIDAVLFDLDGTLADTAPDLTRALNAVLAEQGHPPLPLERVRPQVSHGGRALIRLGFGLEPDDPRGEPLRQALLRHYQGDICRDTRLFSGMETLLWRLERAAIPWGVVTNKPGWLTRPLLQGLGLEARAGCVVSGDSLPQSKPHPAPLLHACHELGAAPGRSWYLGDARRDIEAARAAGCHSLVALWGYLDGADRPCEWGADGCVADPRELARGLEAGDGFSGWGAD